MLVRVVALINAIEESFEKGGGIISVQRIEGIVRGTRRIIRQHARNTEIVAHDDERSDEQTDHVG